MQNRRLGGSRGEDRYLVADFGWRSVVPAPVETTTNPTGAGTSTKQNLLQRIESALLQCQCRCYDAEADVAKRIEKWGKERAAVLEKLGTRRSLVTVAEQGKLVKLQQDLEEKLKRAEKDMSQRRRMKSGEADVVDVDGGAAD